MLWCRLSYWFFSCLPPPILLWLYFRIPAPLEAIAWLMYVAVLTFCFASGCYYLLDFFFLLLMFSFFIFCDWYFFVQFRLELPLLSLPGVTKLPLPFPAIHLQPLPLTHRYILHLFLFEQHSAHLHTHIYIERERERERVLYILYPHSSRSSIATSHPLIAF